MKAMRDGLDVPLSSLVGLPEQELRARLRPALTELATHTSTLAVSLPIPLMVLGTVRASSANAKALLQTLTRRGECCEAPHVAN